MCLHSNIVYILPNINYTTKKTFLLILPKFWRMKYYTYYFQKPIQQYYSMFGRLSTHQPWGPPTPSPHSPMTCHHHLKTEQRRLFFSCMNGFLHGQATEAEQNEFGSWPRYSCSQDLATIQRPSQEPMFHHHHRFASNRSSVASWGRYSLYL